MSVITPREPPAAAIGLPTGTMARAAGRRHQRLEALGAGALLSVAVAFGAVLLLRPADAPPQAASSTVSVPALDLANGPTQALPDDNQAQADAVDRAQYLNDQVADHNNRLAQQGPLSPRVDVY